MYTSKRNFETLLFLIYMVNFWKRIWNHGKYEIIHNIFVNIHEVLEYYEI